jgi:hypothetical protein
MIRQVAYLPHYDWTIKAYFAVTGYWVNEIMAELAYAGANEEEMRLSYISLISGNLNEGICFSGEDSHTSIMVVAKTSSAAEFYNSTTHEFCHLAGQIAQIVGVDPAGEEVAYMVGDMARDFYPSIKHLLCDGCRKGKHKVHRH